MGEQSYKVSFHPDRGWRWWHPDGLYRFGGEYCDTAAEQRVRDATSEEMVEIKRIERAAHQNRPATTAVERFLTLAARQISTRPPDQTAVYK